MAKVQYQRRYDANTREYKDNVNNICAGFGDVEDDEIMQPFLCFPELDIDAFALATLLWNVDGDKKSEVINFCFKKTNLHPIQILRCLLKLEYNSDYCLFTKIIMSTQIKFTCYTIDRNCDRLHRL